MTANELEAILASAYLRSDYDFLFRKAEREQDFFNLVWSLSKEKPFDSSWRLLWILDHATEKNSDFILPILDELYELVLETENESYIRQAMKLILRCRIREHYATQLLERCIQWMTNPKAKISSQALGLEFFYQVCSLYPEMAPELLAYIEDIMDRNPSAGYRIRLLQIRQSLEK
jgi:hypothetical protein